MGSGCSNSNSEGDRVVNSQVPAPRMGQIQRPRSLNPEDYPQQQQQYNHQQNHHSHHHHHQNQYQNMQQPRQQIPLGVPVSMPQWSGSNSNSEMGALLDLGHPMNVNRRYGDCFEYYRDHFTGDGVKFTHSYCSKIPDYKLEEKRNEFWDTRVEGKAETWEALKLACEGDDETTMTIIQALDLQLVNNSLQMCFDRTGQKYDVPIFCLNDPIKYKVPQKKQLAKEELTGQMIHLKVRKAGVSNDVEMQVPNNITGFEMKQEYIRRVKENIHPSKVRLFFGGKEMQDKALIAEYGVQDDLVVQVFVKKDQ